MYIRYTPGTAAKLKVQQVHPGQSRYTPGTAPKPQVQQLKPMYSICTPGISGTHQVQQFTQGISGKPQVQQEHHRYSRYTLAGTTPVKQDHSTYTRYSPGTPVLGSPLVAKVACCVNRSPVLVVGQFGHLGGTIR